MFNFRFIRVVIHLGIRLLNYTRQFRLVLHWGLNNRFNFQLEFICLLVILLTVRFAYISQFNVIL